MVRHQGQAGAGPLGVSMAKGGDIIAMGNAWPHATGHRSRPAGRHPGSTDPGPAEGRDHLGRRVRARADRGRGGGAGRELPSAWASTWRPGFKFSIDVWPGLVVGITIPLVLAITFVTMYVLGRGPAQDLAGLADHCLGLLVDDAIIAVEMMVRKLEEGYDKLRAATFAYDVTAMPMLTGTLITAVGFCPSAWRARRWANTPSPSLPSRRRRWSSGGSCRSTSCPTWAPCCAPRPHAEGQRTRFSTPVLCPLSPAGRLVRGAPLEDHRHHRC